MYGKAGFCLGLTIWISATLAALGQGEGTVDSDVPGAHSLTRREHLLLGTDPDQAGAYLEIHLPDSAHLHYQLSRTSALDYLNWLKRGKWTAEDVFGAETAGGAATNLYKFGLDCESPDSRIPVRNAMPRQVTVSIDGRNFQGLEFIASKSPQNSRIVYSLEGDSGNGWESLDFPEPFSREELGNGFERLIYLDTSSPADERMRRLRLNIRYEPVPAIFAHYISDLNPGWSAMAHIAQPIPAYFRLFHDQPQRMQPAPKGPSDRFRSMGGLLRDLPLLPPGYSFSSAIESAELEIRRARRAGIDGFAVNCLGGRTEFVEALFEAASLLHQREEELSPFLITLSIDINVLPFEDREMLPAVADLIKKWLAAGDQAKHRPHLARRGGKPVVMGYQSHWIWIDYLERLLELWERQDGIRFRWDDGRLCWPDALGPPPAVPVLPTSVIAEYRRRTAERLRDLNSLKDLMEDEEYREDYHFFRENGLSRRDAAWQTRQSVTRRHARSEAAREWARDPDGWRYIRKAYRLLERMVGEEIFWQFDAVDIDGITGNPERALQVIGREFPAVNMFLPNGRFTDLARRVIRDSGAEWGEPIYSQYVAYGQNEQEGLFRGNAHGGDGTGTFRRSWYNALGTNLETGERVVDSRLTAAPDNRSSLIQYTTWNDYGEHSHLAPSLQMRYALADLSRYFIHTWKTVEAPTELGEQVFVFYRKYPERCKTASFPFEHAPGFHPAQFEVVTILRENARLELLREDSADPLRAVPRAATRSLRCGFQVETYAGAGESELWAEGPVTARVTKVSGDVISATGWEEVTHRPFRQDETLVGASSRCADLWREDAPETKPRTFTYSEYGDADGDGLPNWFEMLYFGQGWLNLNDLTDADARGDENRDGISNLSHYRNGTNPTYFAEPIPYHEDRRGNPEPLHIGARGSTRIQAEEFDRGGLGVAYHREEYETMRAGSYRKTRYDFAAHRKVDAHEEDGGDWMVGPVADGEWMTYTIEIPAGCYRASARVREGGGSIILELDDQDLLKATIESQGLWSTQTLGEIEISPEQAGKGVLRLKFASPGFGLNWIEFKRCRKGR